MLIHMQILMRLGCGQILELSNSGHFARDTIYIYTIAIRISLTQIHLFQDRLLDA